jgi:hypothetical protein
METTSKFILSGSADALKKCNKFFTPEEFRLYMGDTSEGMFTYELLTELESLVIFDNPDTTINVKRNDKWQPR